MQEGKDDEHRAGKQAESHGVEVGASNDNHKVRAALAPREAASRRSALGRLIL
jgi:hypothetical protein